MSHGRVKTSIKGTQTFQFTTVTSVASEKRTAENTQ